ncbi:MAG TPA: chemotaxis protein CheD [Caldithrix abyssi]|uniref:Probable chemoreceptor glutamine deamidase CheD n=1 Tax=Caldithrix abyssi TaxID=187145 RepID=A0A7V5VEV8_CALAY|nr:chemotaxis protein CheD [Caldithrix abyssi]
MDVINVGVGEIGVSNKTGSVVKTYALGSCVALIFIAPKYNAVGLAHIALPDSTFSNGKSRELPGYFADLAIPKLIDEFKKLGVKKNSEVVVKMTGGAKIMDPQGRFNIGKRNVLATKKILWKYKLGAIKEDVGKNFSRTVSVSVDTKDIVVSSPGRGEWKL